MGSVYNRYEYARGSSRPEWNRAAAHAFPSLQSSYGETGMTTQPIAGAVDALFAASVPAPAKREFGPCGHERF